MGWYTPRSRACEPIRPVREPRAGEGASPEAGGMLVRCGCESGCSSGFPPERESPNEANKAVRWGKAGIHQQMNLWIYARSSPSTRGESGRKKRWCGRLSDSFPGKRLAMARRRRPIRRRLTSNQTPFSIYAFAFVVRARRLSLV